MYASHIKYGRKNLLNCKSNIRSRVKENSTQKQHAIVLQFIDLWYILRQSETQNSRKVKN